MDAPGWATLTEDEVVVWNGRPVIFPYLSKILLGIVIVGLGIGTWLIFNQGQLFGVSIPPVIPSLLGGLVILLGILIGAKPFLEWWNVRYLVTTEEVYKKRGIISRSVTNLPLRQIQNTSFSQSILGRLLSFGHVRIDTAGGSGAEIVLHYVSEPEDVVGSIGHNMERQR